MGYSTLAVEYTDSIMHIAVAFIIRSVEAALESVNSYI